MIASSPHHSASLSIRFELLTGDSTDEFSSHSSVISYEPIANSSLEKSTLQELFQDTLYVLFLLPDVGLLIPLNRRQIRGRVPLRRGVTDFEIGLRLASSAPQPISINKHFIQ
ncbi:hypothetical protein Y032_0047g1487 [Ancylostoma ceylanicum]|uniref:Uncharacterized protein n=1 Tax=Ancylostoma ceylanicum TaxID=53326 RepID=A0A016UAW0_9BILA|nr:hypothetical protein Y032_0047g1487 [Ancylostoma ceylanicum]